MTKKNFILYKATIINNLLNQPIYINQESRDFIDKIQAEGYLFNVLSKNQGYFELEFIPAGKIFDNRKNKIRKKNADYYDALLDDFLDLYYEGRYIYPNDKYAF